jgi:hypothetical protein
MRGQGKYYNYSTNVKYYQYFNTLPHFSSAPLLIEETDPLNN